MTDRELFEQALAALCQSSEPKSGYRRNELFLSPKAHIELYQEAIEALRARLAQPELVIQARKEDDLIVVDLPKVPTGGGGIFKEEL